MAQKNVETRRAQAAPEQPATVPAGSSAERTRTRPTYAPRTDIYETEAGLVLLVELPGVRADDADVMLEKNVLTIRGRTREHAPQGFSPIYREYETGDFERTFTLSDELDAERIEASADSGVLRLFLPKVGPAQTKRIEVRGG